MTASARLADLRARMAALRYDAFIVPSEDAHMSEYVAACDERRAFVSAFDGSAGTVVVTRDAALCWTDGRYFVQAQAQLDRTCFQMMRLHEDPNVDQWLIEHLPPDAVVGVDGTTMSVGTFERMRSSLSAGRSATGTSSPTGWIPKPGTSATSSSGGHHTMDTGAGNENGEANNTTTDMVQDGAAHGKSMHGGLTLVTLPPGVTNLVDQVWGEDRPLAPASNIFVHGLEYAGQSVQGKLESVRSAMRNKDCSHLVVTGLDEVAWLLNLRGSDVEYNPVFWSYVVVSLDAGTTLYVNTARLSKEARDALDADHVSVSGYESLWSDLAALPNRSVVWIDPAVCNYAICHAIEDGATAAAVSITIYKAQGPIPLAKAKKNAIEICGMRAAHLRDGVAMVKFLSWLEEQVVVEGKEPTECEAADKLDGLRAKQAKFVSLSFPTISSSGPNAAIVHYRPMPEACAKVTRDAIYLVDSGGQYLDGTTDVTRTMHFGTPSDWEKECFTRVLRGHISLDTAVFPKGTTGQILDSFARKPLWEAGLDYKHGTGHGVGCFLNVHEGPHVLSFKPAAQATPLEPGFMSSNEPGYYQAEDNESRGFGIRIENVCVTTTHNPSQHRGVAVDRPYYTFEHLTLVPIQTKMIDPNLLSPSEIGWVDSYNEECRAKLSQFFEDDPKAMEWLRANTAPMATAS